MVQGQRRNQYFFAARHDRFTLIIELLQIRSDLKHIGDQYTITRLAPQVRADALQMIGLLLSET